MTDDAEVRGTYECPICAWPAPHSHSAKEIAERPHIDGARSAFERLGREWMAQPYFMGPRTGYYWAYEADLARAEEPPRPPFTTPSHGWAARQFPTGPYVHDFVEKMWGFWRMAWLAARKAEPEALPSQAMKE